MSRQVSRTPVRFPSGVNNAIKDKAELVLDPYGNTESLVGASGGTGDEDEIICAAGVRAAGFTTD